MSEAHNLVLEVDRFSPRRRRPGHARVMRVPDAVPTRVYLYSKDAILRNGVSAQLHHDPTIELPATGGMDPYGVAVIIADDLLGDVLSAIGGIRRACTARIVVLASRLTPLTTSAALDAGAWYILRRTEIRPGELAATIRRAAEALSPPSGPAEALGDLVYRLDEDAPVAPPRPNGLAARDIEVLRLLADGRSTAIIATDLAYSESTIKNTVHAIVQTLGANNRAHAVAMAIRSGLI